MVDNASMLFNGLTQGLNTNTTLRQQINFSKLKNEFNACLAEEVKVKCPEAIAQFNNRINSFTANYNEVALQHGLLSSAKTQVFSVLRSDYDNKVVMTPAKYQELSQAIAPSMASYKRFLNKAQDDIGTVSSLIENELATCLLK